MSPEDQKVYETYLDLFIHPGWTQLMEDLKELREPVTDLRYTRDLEDLYTNKGKLEVLDYLINFSSILESHEEEEEADEALRF
jgi:hypothetical protein